MAKHNLEEPLKRSVLQDMASIPAGMFLMGSNDFYPEERPVHRVRIDEFWIDKYPVTNAAFRTFVESTGYVTFPERPLNPADYPEQIRAHGARFSGFSKGEATRRSPQLPQLVGLCPWRNLEPS